MLAKPLADLERATGREVNATAFTQEEWASRVASDEHVATTLLREPKVVLIGQGTDLKALGRAADD